MYFQGAIFDLDGVIVNTVPLHYASWKHVFTDNFGVSFTMHDYEEKVDGKPRIDGVLSILPHLNREEAIAAGEIKQKYYFELLEKGQIITFPESFTLIEELLQRGVLLATASSSKNTKYILDKIGLAKKMSAIISGYDFAQGKPHPEIFLNAAKALNIPVKNCIVFEDAKVGVEAAKAGSFFCVGIDRHGKPENYQKADLVVKDLSEVNFGILNELLKKSD